MNIVISLQRFEEEVARCSKGFRDACMSIGAESNNEFVMDKRKFNALLFAFDHKPAVDSEGNAKDCGCT